ARETRCKPLVRSNSTPPAAGRRSRVSDARPNCKRTPMPSMGFELLRARNYVHKPVLASGRRTRLQCRAARLRAPDGEGAGMHAIKHPTGGRAMPAFGTADTS